MSNSSEISKLCFQFLKFQISACNRRIPFYSPTCRREPWERGCLQPCSIYIIKKDWIHVHARFSLLHTTDIHFSSTHPTPPAFFIPTLRILRWLHSHVSLVVVALIFSLLWWTPLWYSSKSRDKHRHLSIDRLNEGFSVPVVTKIL